MKENNRVRWAIIFVIAWILVYIITAIIFSAGFIFIGLFFLFLGTLGTLFNKQLYNWMVQLNTWGFGKMGSPEFGKAVKSNFYRRFYRIVAFLVGLLCLVLGVFAILLYFGIDLMGYFG